MGGRLHVTRDVVFDESKGWSWEASESVVPENLTVEFTVSGGNISNALVIPAASSVVEQEDEEPHTPVSVAKTPTSA